MRAKERARELPTAERKQLRKRAQSIMTERRAKGAMDGGP